MVSEGFTPPTVGNTEPSQIQRFGISQLRQSASTTLLFRVAAHPRRSVEMAGIIILRPKVPGIGGSQGPGHEFEGVIDQPLVVVAPGIGDAGNPQTVLIDLVSKGDAIGFLRQHLADDLETDHVVVVFHFSHQARAPEAVRAHLRIGP